MIYKNSKPPLNTPVWAVAYNINDETKRTRLICTPTLGEVIKRGWKTEFVPYKKGAKVLRESGEVDVYSRKYADTYGEAVELYNSLIQERINKLNEMVNEAESHFIKLSPEEN